MPLSFELPWRRKPLPPPRPRELSQEEKYEESIARARRELDEKAEKNRALAARLQAVTSSEIDDLLASVVIPPKAPPKRRTYSDPLRSVRLTPEADQWHYERLDLIVREYEKRHENYKHLTMGQWLFAHGVRISD